MKNEKTPFLWITDPVNRDAKTIVFHQFNPRSRLATQIRYEILSSLTVPPAGVSKFDAILEMENDLVLNGRWRISELPPRDPNPEDAQLEIIF